MIRWQWAIVFSTILMLPACVFQTNKQVQKKSSFHPSDEGSIFASVSEQSIREDVHACYVAQEFAGNSFVGGGSEFFEQSVHCNGAGHLTKKQLHERAAELQALLSDIPVPMRVQPLADFFANERVALNKVLSLGYRTELPADHIVRFYQQEMERNGWRMITSGFTHCEVFLCFSKPNRFCSVSVRSSVGKSRHKKPGVEIIIFTGPAVISSAFHN